MARSINLGNACDVGVAAVVVVATATAATVAAAASDVISLVPPRDSNIF